MANRTADAGGRQEDLLGIDTGAASRPRKLTPKRPQSDTAGLADVFPYYAGFSFEWARTQLQVEADPTAAIVLDPWNGSGTTTLAARSNQIPSIGVDLNPIANVVAQLRVQVGGNARQCNRLLVSNDKCLERQDPLLAWFTEDTALRVRQWAATLKRLPRPQSALGYVSLFRVVRALTGNFEGSNPTWVRRASKEDTLVDVEHSKLDALVEADQELVAGRLSSESYATTPVSIVTASSKKLPLADQSVDLVLTSPPYLTRIDYAVAYSRELAVLGINVSQDRTLRADLMGTTLIRARRDHNEDPYGLIATDLVRQIRSHSSKASSGYYLKQTRQYLDDLVASFEEITRVSKDDAVMKLVVQDSYYKEIPVRLADICVEEAQRRGWEFIDWDKSEVTRLLTQVNTAARAYSKGKVEETVIVLRRKRRDR